MGSLPGTFAVMLSRSASLVSRSSTRAEAMLGFFSLTTVILFVAFVSLWPLLGSNMEFHSGINLSNSDLSNDRYDHGLGHSDFLPVFSPDFDVVSKMPILRIGMHVDRQKVLLGKKRLCTAQICSKSRRSLLYLPTPCL